MKERLLPAAGRFPARRTGPVVPIDGDPNIIKYDRDHLSLLGDGSDRRPRS